MTVIETTPPETILELKRVFAAPKPLLFKVWTQPEHMVRWWGCADATNNEIQTDLRPGGAFSVRMELADGTVHRIWGEYREIDEPDRLVFTWSWKGETGFEGGDTLVTVTFEEVAGGTAVILRHENFTKVEDRDSHGEGWGASLDRLVDFLAGP